MKRAIVIAMAMAMAFPCMALTPTPGRTATENWAWAASAEQTTNIVTRQFVEDLGISAGVTPAVVTNIAGQVSTNVVTDKVAPWAMKGQPRPSGEGITTNAVKDIASAASVTNAGAVASAKAYADDSFVSYSETSNQTDTMRENARKNIYAVKAYYGDVGYERSTSSGSFASGYTIRIVSGMDKFNSSDTVELTYRGVPCRLLSKGIENNGMLWRLRLSNLLNVEIPFNNNTATWNMTNGGTTTRYTTSITKNSCKEYIYNTSENSKTLDGHEVSHFQTNIIVEASTSGKVLKNDGERLYWGEESGGGGGGVTPQVVTNIVTNVVSQAYIRQKLGVYLYVGPDNGIYVHVE